MLEPVKKVSGNFKRAVGGCPRKCLFVHLVVEGDRDTEFLNADQNDHDHSRGIRFC
jgi:hypothetical protein